MYVVVSSPDGLTEGPKTSQLSGTKTMWRLRGFSHKDLLAENMPGKEETNQFICKVIQPLTECPSTKGPFSVGR